MEKAKIYPLNNAKTAKPMQFPDGSGSEREAKAFELEADRPGPRF